MHRREHEVARLGCLQRGLGGFRVTQLADQDHVRVLAQRAPERLVERVRVQADLALVDDAAVVDVEELDRVLDRHDVLAARAVDVRDQRGKRGRLPRARRAGDEDQAAMLVRKLLDADRQVQVVEAGDLGRDHTEGEGGCPPLLEAVDAEAGEVRGHVRRVELAGLPELLEPVRCARGYPLEDRLEIGLAERLPALECAQVAVAAHDRGQPEFEVHVGGAAFDDTFQEGVEVHGRATLTIGNGITTL